MNIIDWKVYKRYKAQKENQSSFFLQAFVAIKKSLKTFNCKGAKKTFNVASNDQKSALPLQRSRGQSRAVEKTILVSDVANESAQIVLSNRPKTSTSTSASQHIVKTITPPSTSVSQSTSGVMTGVKFFSLICFYCSIEIRLPFVSQHCCPSL